MPGVPVAGPVLIAGNHVSFLDFVLMCRAARRSRRYVRFLATHEVWKHRVARPLMNGMGHIPVDRGAPASAYLAARSALRSGEAVGIFPEAGVSTSFTVRSLMPGTVALAAETGAPIVPIAIWGPQRIYTAGQRLSLARGRPVSVLVGSPFPVETSADVVAETLRLGGVLQSMVMQRRPLHQPAPGEHAPWHPAHLGGAAPTPAEAQLTESMPTTSVPPTWAASAAAPGTDRVDHHVEVLSHPWPGQQKREYDGRRSR